MSLYRQYRPRIFADVAGQDHIVETLSQAVKAGQTSHAYLFAGTRGTGKTSIARILAKEMLLVGIADELLRKHIIDAVDEGSLVDLVEIDAASNRGIDDIRSLLEKIQFTPVVAGAKVYIIDEVHMLTREAFNALLKTLEEPPAYAFFILATTELHKIPPTIQSRCQRFLFRQIREEDIVQRLQFIADSEHITIERPALRAIAHHGAGSMRDAISLLDQLRSSDREIMLSDVKQRVGESGHEFVERVLSAIGTSDRETIVNVVQALEEAAVPLDTFVRLLLGEARDRLHRAIDAKEDIVPLVATIDRLMEALRDLRLAPVPGLTLEAALLSMAGSPLATKGRETAVEQNKDEPQTMSHQPDLSAVVQPIRLEGLAKAGPKQAEILAPELSFELLREQWPDIVQKTMPASSRMSLKNGQLQALEGTTVIVRFGSSFHRDKASNREGMISTEQTLKDLFKQPLRLRYVLDSELHGASPVPEQESVNMAEAAVELF